MISPPFEDLVRTQRIEPSSAMLSLPDLIKRISLFVCYGNLHFLVASRTCISCLGEGLGSDCYCTTDEQLEEKMVGKAS